MVGSWLRTVYVKLGIESRFELAAKLDPC